MNENVDDSGIRPGVSYRCQLLNALMREAVAERKAAPVQADLERILLDSDPYLVALTRGETKR